MNAKKRKDHHHQMETTYKSFGSIDADIDIQPSPCLPPKFARKSEEVLLNSNDKPLEASLNNNPQTSSKHSQYHVYASTGNLNKISLPPNIEHKDKCPVVSSSTNCESSQHHSTYSSGFPIVKSAYASNNTNRNARKNKSDFHHFQPKSNLFRNASERSKLSGSSIELNQNSVGSSMDWIQHRHFDPPTLTSSVASRSRRKKNMRDIKKTNVDRERSMSARNLFSSLRGKKQNLRQSFASASDVAKVFDEEKEKQQQQTETNELSSDANLPGIMKIFGDEVSPGANYKSIMATQNSTAKELCRTALKRYGVCGGKDVKQFVLCEVLGRLVEKQVTRSFMRPRRKRNGKSEISTINENSEAFDAGSFVEDYVRPLADYEKPLVLQSLWKPLDGHCRRFEIRKKSNVKKVIEKTPKDIETRGVNNQARRLLMHKSRSCLGLSVSQSIANLKNLEIESESSSSSSSSSDEDQVFSSSSGTHNKDDVMITTPSKSRPHSTHLSTSTPIKKTPSTSIQEEEVEEPKESLESNKQNSKNPPVPFLIILQGHQGTDVVRHLETSELIMGGNSDSGIFPELQRKHCSIVKRLETLFRESENYTAYKSWRVCVTSVSDESDVLVNNAPLSGDRELNSGDVITINKRYVVMYKDPNCSDDVMLQTDDVITNVKSAGKNSPPATRRRSDLPGVGNVQPEEKLSMDGDVIKCDVMYDVTREDELLQHIFVHFGKMSGNELMKMMRTPSTILGMCIVYTIINHTDASNDFLLKIAGLLHKVISDATREISEAEAKNQAHDTKATISLLVFWMENSLHLFQFLHNDLMEMIESKLAEEKRRKKVTAKRLDKLENFSLNIEVTSRFEEVVMFAFQYLVYHLTKILYTSLQSVLDSNPFSEAPSNGSSGGESRNVEGILRVFNFARELMTSFEVNSDINRQLFSYLFFFTNVSLFNTVMEHDSNNKYFSWQRGVIIAGNLEKLENWASENDYKSQWYSFMGKTIQLAELLSTPKSHITRYSWRDFRQNFSQLHPVQLRHILANYSLPTDPPVIWSPDDDVTDLSSSDKLLESCDNHPPLMLPRSGSKINFSNENQTLAQVISHYETFGLTFSFPLVGVREQPDGREKTSNNDATPPNYTSSPPTLENTVEVDTGGEMMSLTGSTEARTIGADVASRAGEGRFVTSSSCSSASDPAEIYVTKQHKSQLHHQILTNEPALVQTFTPSSKMTSPEEKFDDSDEAIVLPITETIALPSKISKSISEDVKSSPSNFPVSISTMSLVDAVSSPAEVFSVDIEIGGNGLCVGLIDGLVTSCNQQGVFVRSLLPDSSNFKSHHSRHRYVMKCSLQSGRLQVGDRILSVNGVSLVNMKYSESMKNFRRAGEKIRLLVARCAADISLKVTSSAF